MMPSPLISIVVPCYNYGEYLKETLDSVFNQSYKNWECIVVDDGSTDNTFEVVNSFMQRDDRFFYYYQSNNGLSSARNTGINAAKGNWIQFLDADDILHYDKFSIQLSLASALPEIDIFFSSFFYFKEKEEILNMTNCRLRATETKYTILSSEEVLNRLFKYNLTVVNAPILSKKIAKKVGNFDCKLESLEDWDYWTRAAILGIDFCKIETVIPLAFVRKHAKSMSTNRNVMRGSRIKLFHKTRGLLNTTIEVESNKAKMRLPKQLISGLKYFYGDLAFEEIQMGSFWKGLKWILLFRYSSFSDILFFIQHGLYSIKLRILKIN